MPEDPAVPTEDLGEAWRRFNPVMPLPSGSPWYVDCAAERGIHRFVDRMRLAVGRAAEGTGQQLWLRDLVVGQRGSGKSTELLRLKSRLEEDGFYVHYVDVAQSVPPDQIDCEAILTIVLRTLLDTLQARRVRLNDQALDGVRDWFGSRVQTVVGQKSAQVGVDVGAALQAKTPLSELFAKFTGFMRWGTNTEDRLTVTYKSYLGDLGAQLDPLLIDADQKLRRCKATRQGLIVIVDSLDHIRVTSRQDEVFLESADILADLSAHMVYTVPPAVYATGRMGAVQRSFGTCHWLPVVKIRDVAGHPYQAGLDRMREVVAKRCDESLFDPEGLDWLCRFSGGHTRHMVRLAQEAIADTAFPPVTLSSAKRAIGQLSDTLAAGCTPGQWLMLAQSDADPHLAPTSDEHRDLLFTDRLLVQENGEGASDDDIPGQWYGVHPAVKRRSEFRAAELLAAKGPSDANGG